MFLLVAAVASITSAQVNRNRFDRSKLDLRSRLRLRPDQDRRSSTRDNANDPTLDEDDLRDQRQLPASSRIRTRGRVRRPTIVRSGDIQEEDISFTLSRNPTRFQEPQIESQVQEEEPRFVPSRGGAGGRGGGENRVSAASSLTALTRGGSSSSRNSISAPKLSSPNADGYKLVCYYTNWSQYRPKKGKFLPEYIDPFLCTHVIFAFGWIKEGRLTSFEKNDVSGDGKAGLYQRVVGLKAKNPKLKVILAIGGWSFGTSKFKEVAENRFSRQKFIYQD